jgi:hypothetical protein
MSLETLKPKLEALPTDQLRSPNIPVANALQEASDLGKLCRRLCTTGRYPVATIVVLACAKESSSLGSCRCY